MPDSFLISLQIWIHISYGAVMEAAYLAGSAVRK